MNRNPFKAMSLCYICKRRKKTQPTTQEPGASKTVSPKVKTKPAAAEVDTRPKTQTPILRTRVRKLPQKSKHSALASAVPTRKRTRSSWSKGQQGEEIARARAQEAT